MLDHIHVGVSDLERSAAFYCGAFALDPDGHNVEAVCHR
jgi:catechol 2,3-dioxygenase-like lactoylglutathione lyase family enzyme